MLPEDAARIATIGHSSRCSHRRDGGRDEGDVRSGRYDSEPRGRGCGVSWFGFGGGSRLGGGLSTRNVILTISKL
jgi:hypothetical protein